MNCKKCGKKLQSKENFCTVCGYYNEINDLSQTDEFNSQLDYDYDDEIFAKEEKEKDLEEFSTNFDFLEDNNLKEETSREEIFLQAYIGEDYNLIKNGIFNIFAALLNWMYLLYRKMYILGILGLVTTGFFIIKLKKYLPIYIIIVAIVIGLIFNKIYIVLAKRKIKKLEEKYEGSDDTTLEEIMEEKGGVNFVPAIIIYFIFIIVIVISMFPNRINKSNNIKFLTENSENKANCTYLVKESYKQLQAEKDSYHISEAACKLIKTTTTDYDIYLKDISLNVNNYYYYKVRDSHIDKQIDTTTIKELKEKSINNTITEEEKAKLIEMQNVKNNYQKIYDEAKKEDKLIREEKNTTEKKNYIFSQEEITK